MTDQRIFDAIDQLALELVALTARALADAAADLELTLAQWRVLVVVGERRVPLRVGDVAIRIQASLPSTSRILRRLERRGLLGTERDERDRRATLVRLTPAGVAIRRKVVASRQRMIQQALSNDGLPADLEGGLRHIVRALEPIV